MEVFRGKMIKSHMKKIVILSLVFFSFLQYTSQITPEPSHMEIITPQRIDSIKKISPSHINIVTPQTVDFQKKAVVFDLGEVLIKTNRKKARHFLGTAAIGSYMMRDWKNPDSLRILLYDILHTEKKHNETLLLDPYGSLFPTMVCDMLKGIRTESDCHEVAVKLINDSKHLFCSSREHALCLKSAQIVFDADILTTILEPSREGLDLLQECHAAGHEIFILSNFGKEGYIALKEKYPELFELVKDDHIIISGNVNAAKPEAAIYKYLIKKVTRAGISISPETVFFIDDQKENITAALKHNITGIHKKSFKVVRKQLQSLKLI